MKWSISLPKQRSLRQAIDNTTGDNGGENVAPATNNDEMPKDPKELRRLLERARNGDENTLPVLRGFFQKAPSFEEFGGDLARLTEESLIAAAAGKDQFQREALRRKQQLMR